MIQLPLITGRTTEEKVSQMIDYLRNLAEELQRLQLTVEEEKKNDPKR